MKKVFSFWGDVHVALTDVYVGLTDVHVALNDKTQDVPNS